MNANRFASQNGGSVRGIRIPSTPEEVESFYVGLVKKLETLEKSQREAAKNASSESAAGRHEELASGIALTIEFVNGLGADHLRQISVELQR
ncbi:hypothetical protein GCM10010981_09790 [Dyella nitratireducens]|uniref:Uncharacterized protein n=1 Tax=Dyella nitratireducens TaxID=1849580 RepID=A0ABQ1FN66_9GAMM|nr:hypothetical protein GCM10010981_09790 [Dyella nitratireducens]GLQ43958.1 hypothetical protein GCM10007902_38080 [Dyella nitratireducens]